MKGREQFVPIKHRNGKKSEVTGTRYGKWAATIMTVADFNAWPVELGDALHSPDPDYECWTITHIPTGRSIKSQRWLLRNEAEAIAKLLGERYPSAGLTKRGPRSTSIELPIAAGLFEPDSFYIADAIFAEALGEMS